MITWIVQTVFLLFSAWIVPGVHLGGFLSAMLAVFLIGLLNLLVKPILILLTLPITFLTLGLFLIVINAVTFWLAATMFNGFVVDSFTHALMCSCVYSLLNAVFLSKSSTTS